MSTYLVPEDKIKNLKSLLHKLFKTFPRFVYLRPVVPATIHYLYAKTRSSVILDTDKIKLSHLELTL